MACYRCQFAPYGAAIHVILHLGCSLVLCYRNAIRKQSKKQESQQKTEKASKKSQQVARMTSKTLQQQTRNSRQARVGKQESASKSRQARVGKQESASKRRQARVVKQESASKSRQARIDKQESISKNEIKAAEGRSKRHASEASLVEQEDIKARRLQHKYGGVESVSVALEVAFNEMEEDRVEIIKIMGVNVGFNLDGSRVGSIENPYCCFDWRVAELCFRVKGGLNPHEIDISYLKQPVYNASPRGTLKWRKFFQELGVTDFVQIVNAFVVTCFRERMDDQLHFPKDLFHNCETLRDILGHRAPYTIPKKTLTLDVALSILDVWRGSKKPFRAGISQMTKFYTYLWSEMDVSKHKIVETLHFVPHSFDSIDEVVSGLLLTPSEVYWHDSTGLMKQKTLSQAQLYEYNTHHVFSKMLSSVYPGLCHFIVNECGVAESPPLLSYLWSLLQLSTENLTSPAAKTVRNNLFAGLSSLLPKRKDTGREGEHEAFKYFSAELGDKKVTWVNKDKESKLPYDILVEGKNNSKEYIEVKSTSGVKKDWFEISVNEWKSAVEKGEAFSVTCTCCLIRWETA
ncbi:histidine kinase-, DNA gyrase B-, and HSP90-like ATPase family protein [Tanacetum coccineum]